MFKTMCLDKIAKWASVYLEKNSAQKDDGD